MVPDIAGIGHSFKGAMAYYLHDKAQDGGPHPVTSERVAWSEVRNMIDVGPQTATRIMVATASQADELKAAAGVKNTGRKSNAHVYAYSLAWHPDEAAQLTRAEMVRAVDQSLKVLGAEGHQAIVVCHTDQKHPHVHVIVNRVHPETGKMLSTSNDRVKLSEWANGYERERGQILTPKREETRLAREKVRADFDAARRPDRAAPDPAQKARVDLAQDLAQDPQRGKKPSEAALLKELSDAQKVRHKDEWADLSTRHKGNRDQVYSDFGQRIKDAAAAHKAAMRSVWRDHFRIERQDARQFERNERSLTGIIRNALFAAQHQQATGQAPTRGALSLAFANVLNASARAIALAERQQMGRMALSRELKGILDAEVTTLKQQRGIALQQQRDSFTKERAALIDTQNAERAKTREAWRQVYERRGKDPRYHAAQTGPDRTGQRVAWQGQREAVKAHRAQVEPVYQRDMRLTAEQQVKGVERKLNNQARQKAALSPEQKPMRDEFEKNRWPKPTTPRVQTVERTISTPAPAPSPAGMPAPPAQVRQSVPQVDRAAEWAKTPAGRESLAKSAPSPAVRKDFDRSAEQTAAPQTRAEKWNERAKEISSDRKPIERDRSRDRDFDRER